MNPAWPTVRLGEILTERRETPLPEDLLLGTIPIVSKIIFETGRIELRSGSETKTGMILARPGDLIVSGINVAKGAIAIYGPENERPIAATIHYGAYTPRPDRADLKFLWWFFRSRYFRDILSEHVPGGIKTELKAKRLLPIPMPLPPLSEQRRIVARIDSIAGEIKEAKKLCAMASQEAQGLIGPALRRLYTKLPPTGTVGDILFSKPRNGWSARCDNIETGIPVLSLSAVTGFRYRSSEYKRTTQPAAANGHFWLNPGDVLITRSNTPELVGHVAIYDGAPFPCIYPDLMMKLMVNPEAANKEFVWYWFQSPVVREFITKHAKGTSPTMKKISQGIVMSVPFPTNITAAEQRRVVAELDKLQAEVDVLKRHQAETAAELDAFLPAILDRAFQGKI